MRAVVVEHPFGLPGVRVVERPEPGPPGPGQILVRLLAASLNFRDLLVARAQGHWAPPSGRVLGSDAAGEVVAVGADVTRFAPGDRVLSTFAPGWQDGPLTAGKLQGTLGGAKRDGVLAEHLLMDAEAAVRAPVHLSSSEAATLVCAGVTAWHALSKGHSLRRGTSVLVQGTGGVSTFALQIAATAGARVIVTSSSDAKLEGARRMGAAETVNYHRHPDWEREVLRLTDGAGVDHALDVGGAATLERAIAATGYEGLVSVVGLLGGSRAEIDVQRVLARNIRLHGVETGSRKMLEDLVAWTAVHRLRPIVAQEIPMSEAGRAFAMLAEQSQVGKICVVP